MKPKHSSPKKPAERVVKDIRRATRRHFSAEDKIRIVIEGLRGDDSDKEPKGAVATISSGNSGTSLQRRMANGGSFLNYNLYTSSSRSTVWGDGSSGTGVVTFGVKPQTNYVLPVYGRIPPLQNVPKGPYSDVVMVTITF